MLWATLRIFNLPISAVSWKIAKVALIYIAGDNSDIGN